MSLYGIARIWQPTFMVVPVAEATAIRIFVKTAQVIVTMVVLGPAIRAIPKRKSGGKLPPLLLRLLLDGHRVVAHADLRRHRGGGLVGAGDLRGQSRVIVTNLDCCLQVSTNHRLQTCLAVVLAGHRGVALAELGNERVVGDNVGTVLRTLAALRGNRAVAVADLDRRGVVRNTGAQDTPGRVLAGNG